MYWILFIFIAVGIFYPIIGYLALICMIGPVALALSRGRYWCGHICPRGSLYDRLISRISPQRKIPAALQSLAFRRFMIVFIGVVFGVKLYYAWGNLVAIGGVFIQIIVLTTVVGIVLGIVYQQRTWCNFCPMGTLAAWATPKVGSADKPEFKVIKVADSCIGCGMCAKVCPMQLMPFSGKGDSVGFVHPDCLKCGRCIAKCPKHALKFQ